LIPDFTGAINRIDIGPFVYQKDNFYCNFSDDTYPNYSLYVPASGTSWVFNYGPPLWTNVTMPTAQSVARAEVTAFSNPGYSSNIFWFEGSNNGGSIWTQISDTFSGITFLANQTKSYDLSGIYSSLRIYITVTNGGRGFTKLQYFGTDNSGPDIYFDTSKVGIGNNSPQYEFDVTGDINCSGNYFLNGISFHGYTSYIGYIGYISYTRIQKPTEDTEYTEYTGPVGISSNIWNYETLVSSPLIPILTSDNNNGYISSASDLYQSVGSGQIYYVFTQNPSLKAFTNNGDPW
jgi:hypothetical protein